MSIKNVALDSAVYRRLAAHKRESESFSKAISRLLDSLESAHSGHDILIRLDTMTGLSEADARRMHQIISDARADEPWEHHDLG